MKQIKSNKIEGIKTKKSCFAGFLDQVNNLKNLKGERLFGFLDNWTLKRVTILKTIYVDQIAAVKVVEYTIAQNQNRT